MNLLNLIQNDGFTLTRAATTHGGEYAGACPFCGGKDRFRVWPEDRSGHYWCRGCGKSGDSIQYLREHRGLSFVEACKVMDCDPGARSTGARPAPPAWMPKESKAPSEAWQERARFFLDMAINCLWSDQGEPMRQWLHNEKGLQDATIKTAGLGFNPADKWTPRGTWGLDTAYREDGTERRQWLPAGLVIPLIAGGAVCRLRIRRNNPGDGSRYVVISGSSTAPMTLNHSRAAIVVVESELDALLLSQEAGDLAGVAAMGTATARPDRITHEVLTTAVVILLCTDSDEAGAKVSWGFWPATYGKKVKRWPPVKGKDPSEAYQKGLNVRDWIIAGLFGTEAKFERFCIQTIDGGLSDTEALQEALK